MDSNSKKILIGVSVAAIAVFAVVGALTFMFRDKQASSVTNISNFSTNLSSLDKNTRERIESSLYAIVKLNNPDLDPSTIKDAVIRSDSSIKEETPSFQKGGEFIVDIPSIRQSYRLIYRSSSVASSFDSGYPYLALCVEDDEIIYEPFDCKNNQHSEQPSDPLLRKLPYKGINYSILSGGGSKIVIQVMLTHSQDTNKFFVNYANSAKSWLATEGFDLNIYTLEYRDISNNIVSID